MDTFQFLCVCSQAGDNMAQGPVGCCVPVHSQLHHAHTHILVEWKGDRNKINDVTIQTSGLLTSDVLKVNPSLLLYTHSQEPQIAGAKTDYAHTNISLVPRRSHPPGERTSGVLNNISCHRHLSPLEFQRVQSGHETNAT